MDPSRWTESRWLPRLLPEAQCPVETPAVPGGCAPHGSKRTRPLRLLSSYSRATDRRMLVGPKSTARDSVCTLAGFPKSGDEAELFQGCVDGA